MRKLKYPDRIQHLYALNTYLEYFAKDYYHKIKKAVLNQENVEYQFGILNGNFLVGALDGMDRFLDRYFPSVFHSSGKPYIEIGAYNGMDQSNTLLFELKYSMSGILIECQPDAYHWLTNFRSNKNLFVFGAAVPFGFPEKEIQLALEGLTSEVNIDEYMKSKLSDNVENSSLNKSHLTRCIVPAMTMNDIIQKQDEKDFSLFSLDVEGNEISVMNGIDFEQTHFDLILVESDIKRMVRY